ncbi:hypothetical protein SH528x_005104 [Novipirellula sp. SH528]|uniref:hypothetical protein n=1 Tax=Novipirellula sp. SH528 TaxID=3454466 RepID=UPI003FA08AD9
MRSLKIVGALGLGLVCCLAVAQDPALKTPSNESEQVEEDTRVYPKVYRLQDLPVWTKDGMFSPSLVMSLIQSTISPESWEAKGGPSTMAPYPQNASLVISTSSENHDAVIALLEQFRR